MSISVEVAVAATKKLISVGRPIRGAAHYSVEIDRCLHAGDFDRASELIDAVKEDFLTERTALSVLVNTRGLEAVTPASFGEARLCLRERCFSMLKKDGWSDDRISDISCCL
jgi:hypothetical protein